MTLPLLALCVLPGCTQPVAESGTACQGCTEAFGPMLRHGRPLTAAEIQARDTATDLAYRVMLRKAGAR